MSIKIYNKDEVHFLIAHICPLVHTLYTDTHKFTTDFPRCETNAWAASPLPKQGGPLLSSCKFAEDRHITPGRSLTQNVNSFEK